MLKEPDLVRWWAKRVRYLEWGTDRAPRKFSRPTFPELHEAKEKLIALVVSSVGPPVIYDSHQRFTTHTSCIFVPWHYLKGVRNLSIRKTARYRDEASGTASSSVMSREDLEKQSLTFAPKYLLAVMNASFAKEWLAVQRRSKIHVYPDDWKRLPIPSASPDQQAEIVNAVDQILALYESNGYPLRGNAAERLAELEDEIDRRVSELYAVTAE